MARLKPLRKDEDLNAIPVDQPVLVELEPAPTALIADDDREEDPPARIERTNTSDDEDPGVKTLKQQMAALKTASDTENARLREESRKATERANEAERRATEARTEVADAETSAVESGLAAAQRERDAAKLAVKTAFETGDAEGLANAQERLGRSAADIREFERSAAMLADRKTQDERQRQEPQRQNAPVDLMAGIDSNPNLLPTEKEWMKAHPDAVIDKRRNDRLGFAYEDAIAAGLIRGTPDYFDFIDKFMGYAKAETRRNNDDNDDERTTIVAAPVSRDTRSNATGQQSGSRITLSPEQREMARSMGLSDVEYARGVVQVNADKKSNPEKYFRS